MGDSTIDSMFVETVAGLARNLATIMLKSVEEKEAIHREDDQIIDDLRWDAEKHKESEALLMGQIEKLESKVKGLEQELAKSKDDLLYWYREATALKQKLEEIKTPTATPIGA